MHLQSPYNFCSKAGLACLLAAMLLTLMASSGLMAAGQSSARSVAMGGAGIGLARGIDAFRFNPANLGLDEDHDTEIEILGVGAAITNNSFSLADYNKYTGAVLTSDDKEYILSRVPDEGLEVRADIEASATAVAKGSFVFFTTGVAQADISLNRDLIDLVLNGNTFGDSISVDGSYSEAVAYMSTGFSYGMPIYTWGSRRLAVGATARYIRGFGTEQVVDLSGLLATHETGFAGEGSMVARTATGGSGYSLDFGAALKLSDRYTISASIQNIMSRIHWSQNTEEHGYFFSFDTVTVDNMEEDFITSDDYTEEIGNFSTSLPSVLRIGFARTSGSLLWAVDWEQGFRRAAGSSRQPRLSAGIEWNGLLKVLPIRAGFTAGGSKPTAFAIGSGLHLGPFYMDFAAVTGSTPSPYSSKGLNLAFATGFHF